MTRVHLINVRLVLGYSILRRIDNRELILDSSFLDEVFEGGGFELYAMVRENGFHLSTTLPFGIGKPLDDFGDHLPFGFKMEYPLEASGVIGESGKASIPFYACWHGSTCINMDKAEFLGRVKILW